MSNEGNPMRTDLRCAELPGEEVISAVGGVALVKDGVVAGFPREPVLLVMTGISGELGMRLAGLLGEVAGAEVGPFPVVPIAGELIEWVDDLRKNGMDDGVNLRVVEGRLVGLPCGCDSLVCVPCVLVALV